MALSELDAEYDPMLVEAWFPELESVCRLVISEVATGVMAV